MKQIQEYDIDKYDAKKIAKESINSKVGTPNGIFHWNAGNFYSDLDPKFPNTTVDFFDFEEKKMTLSLKGKEDEAISLGKKISTVFKNNLVCGLVAIASFANLAFSTYKFYKISKLSETVAGKEYRIN